MGIVLIRNTKVLIGASLFTFVVIGVFFGVRNYQNKEAVLPCTNNVNNLLDRSGQLFAENERGYVESSRFEELDTLVADITNKPGYEDDINCMYIVANHSIYMDSESFERAIARVKTLQEQGQNFAQALTNATIDALEFKHELTRNSEDEVRHNTIMIPIFPSGQEESN